MCVNTFCCLKTKSQEPRYVSKACRQCMPKVSKWIISYHYHQHFLLIEMFLKFV